LATGEHLSVFMAKFVSCVTKNWFFQAFDSATSISYERRIIWRSDNIWITRRISIDTEPIHSRDNLLEWKFQ